MKIDERTQDYISKNIAPGFGSYLEVAQIIASECWISSGVKNWILQRLAQACKESREAFEAACLDHEAEADYEANCRAAEEAYEAARGYEEPTKEVE